VTLLFCSDCHCVQPPGFYRQLLQFLDVHEPQPDAAGAAAAPEPVLLKLKQETSFWVSPELHFGQ
jgi:hypothetical protein